MWVSGSLMASTMRAVEFRLGAYHFQRDLFVQRRCQIADHAGKLIEDPADRLHAGLHDAVPEVRR